MQCYSLSHLTVGALERELATSDAQHRTALAVLLAHLAEFDDRRLYLPAGFPSMYLYCLHQLHWCEQAAFKRIRAARTARRFPAIFAALADGRLHLSAVVLLAPYLTTENADELLSATAHRSKSAIEQLLAQRFPRPAVEARVQPLPPLSHQRPGEQHTPGSVEARSGQLSPGTVDLLASGAAGTPLGQHAPVPVHAREDQLSPGTVDLLAVGPAASSAPARMPACADRPRVVPLAPQRFALQLTMSQALHDKLRHAQELLSHQVPTGDVAQVLERALDALIPQLEKRKFAATSRPRRAGATRRKRATTGSRHVPARVKRAVWARDGGQCTFVGATGRRCPARTLLEFDHIDEVARGGEATVAGIRLRCRAHNQYGAECTFGADFMRHKREAAREAAERRKPAAPASLRRAASMHGAHAGLSVEIGRG